MRSILAVAVLIVCVSIAAAEQYFIVITKIDGNKLRAIQTFNKGAKPEQLTMTIAENVKVLTGKYNSTTKKFEGSVPVPNGLKSHIFSKPIRARITTDEAKVITEIAVFQKK